MTDKELALIMATLKTAFPSYYRGISVQDAQTAFNLWKIHFTDCDYKAVSVAVNALIDTSVEGFPPTIGKVKAQMYKLAHRGDMKLEDAWKAVLKALRNSTYNSREEYEKLPESVKRAVGSPETLRKWCMISDEELSTVIYSQFVRIYNARQEESREYAMLAPSVKEYINSLSAGAGERKMLE